MSNDRTARGDFGSVLRMLRRRLPIIVLTPLVAVGVAYGIAKITTKEYTGTAVLEFKPLLLDVQLTGMPLQTQSSDPTTEAATEIGLITLQQVRDQAAHMLGFKYSSTYLKKHVKATQQGKAQLIDIKASAPNPTDAAAIANAMAKSFLAYERQNIVSSLNNGIKSMEHRLRAPNLSRLERSILENSMTKLTELTAVEPDNVQLSALALPPTKPSSPNTKLDVIIGAIVGLLAGLGFAMLAEQMDVRVRRPEEVEDALNLPVLAMIPRSRVLKNGESLSEADLEAFRMLRTNLRYRSGGRTVRTVLLTSAGTESGKTTVSLHLAAAAAAVLDGRVLLVEADLRRPRLAELLGLSSERGLSSVLASAEPLWDVVMTVPGGGAGETDGNVSTISDGNGSGPASQASFPASFDVAVAGPPTPHASELLSSRRMSELLEAAAEKYDLTIVDSPPPGLVSDAIPLIKQVDAVVLVARLGRENSPELRKLQAQLHDLGVEPLGVVANFSRRTANPYVPSGR